MPNARVSGVERKCFLFIGIVPYRLPEARRAAVILAGTDIKTACKGFFFQQPMKNEWRLPLGLCNRLRSDSILHSYATTIVCSASPSTGIPCSGRLCSSRENFL